MKLSPQIFGGEQEKRRAGTENVAGIVGLAEAVQLTKQNRREKAMHYGKLKETMLQVFEEESLNFSINGHRDAHFKCSFQASPLNRCL